MGGDVVDGNGARYHGFSDVGEAAVVVSGVGSQVGECFVHVDVPAFGDHAFGLFDHDSASEGALQLVLTDRCLVGRLIVDESNAREVGECLCEDDVGIGKTARASYEQV